MKVFGIKPEQMGEWKERAKIVMKGTISDSEYGRLNQNILLVLLNWSNCYFPCCFLSSILLL
jgi:hypothetical protein